MRRLSDIKHEKNEMGQMKLLLNKINEDLKTNQGISEEIFDSFSEKLTNPIVGIKAYTDMILNGNFGELTPLQQEKLSRVKENTELLIEVVMQMLDKIKERRILTSQ